jgi:uncharacterized protein YjdB
MKKFKRVLSSLLAAALTVSAVAVANVSSVFADTTYTKTYTFGTNNANLSTDSKEFFTITAVDGSNEADNYYTLVKNSTITFTIPEGATDISGTVNCVASASENTQSIKLNGGGASTKAPAANGAAIDVTLPSNKFTTGTNINTIQCTGATINYYYVSITYTVAGNDDDPSVTITDSAFKLNIGDSKELTAETANADDATISWSSSNDAVATVDNTGKVTGIAAGEATITAKITVDGTDYPSSVKVTVVDPNQVLTAITAADLTNGVVLNPNDLDTATYGEETLAGNNKFALGNKLQKDSSGNKTFTTRKGEVITQADRIKTNGTVSFSKNTGYIKFTLAEDAVPAKVYVAGMTGSNGTERSLQLYNSTGDAVENQILTNDGSDIGVKTMTINTAGTYYLGSTSSGFNVYYVEVYSDAKVDSNKVAYRNIDGTGYAIAVLNGDDVENDSNVSFQLANGSKYSEAVNEVYSNIEIGGTTYSVSDFSNDSNAYLYGFAISRDNDDTQSVTDLFTSLVVQYNQAS